MNQNKAIPALLVLVLLGFGAVLWQQSQILSVLQQQAVSGRGAVGQGQAPAPQAAGQAPKALPALSKVDFMTTLAGVPVKGRSEAQVVVLEFSDFQCPFCGRYVRDTYPRVTADYINTGKVKYAFRQFPLEGIHPNALNSAVAASCAAAQGKFWEMHDRLFANQTSLELPALLNYGGGLGMDEAKYASCVNTRGPLTVIQSDKADALQAGFTGTPAFLVGRIGPDGRLHATRRISGAQPYSVFQSAIDDVLAGK